jgi:lipopolysaccharide transport system ATP-binding protein
MKKREIEAKVKEIAEFAGLESFMDIPVNHYSCGTAMRLEFAIATHFPCDILLVDDKLEACDPEFRRKCIYKMENMSRDGVTVIFASHNMQAVERLCRLCIVIRNGRIAFVGSTTRAIKDTRGLE